jgi:predicted DNA-binding protein YlxM (UPF0122 family)
VKTIKQIADELGVSKQAVFYRIKKPPLSNALQSLTTKIDGVLMVELDGEVLIKRIFSEKTVKAFVVKEPSKENSVFDGEIVQLLKDNIALLQEQLKVKDEQLAAAQEALKAEQLLHANTKKMLMLPSPVEQQEPRGLFARLFKRRSKE